MNKRGDGIPMSQRVAMGATPARPAHPPDAGPARHCWVADAADRQGVKRPGLLIAWRHTGGGWEGQVIYSAMLRPGEWAVVQEWLPAAFLVPGSGHPF